MGDEDVGGRPGWWVPANTAACDFCWSTVY